MPYILSKTIRHEDQGLWREGSPYSSKVIYDIRANDPKLPPVQYSSHTLCPHSLPHVDAPAHILPDGKTIDHFFTPKTANAFFGPAVVVQLPGSRWEPLSTMPGNFLWRVSREELQQSIRRVTGSEAPPEKLVLSAANVPIGDAHGHDHNYVLVLTEEAAEWLVENPKFNAYATSWKSTDFEPNSRKRPIHTILFRQALVFECLELTHVPEGIYFWSAFPLPLQQASEAPVCPVLFTKDEIRLSSL